MSGVEKLPPKSMPSLFAHFMMSSKLPQATTLSSLEHLILLLETRKIQWLLNIFIKSYLLLFLKFLGFLTAGYHIPMQIRAFLEKVLMMVKRVYADTSGNL